MPTNKPKNILIAPLDWGLGHTTRCVPLISHILSLGHSVTVAGNASQRTYLRETFGDIDLIDLEGYNITYSAWNRWAQIGLLSQLPAIKRTITAEQQWLQQLTAARKIDGIISDNRYGLHHKKIPSVMITHQLQVRSGLGAIADRVVRHLHYKLLGRFWSIWVADAGAKINLGGKLSHPKTLPVHASYIGLLSRFAEPTEREQRAGQPLLILLSGPEPQRSILSKLLWEQALGLEEEVIFVEGSEAAIPPAFIPPHIIYHKRLSGAQLAPMLHDAGIVICRSGYSTLMDLVALGKKAILIPTPGQTEQQYLARHLHREGVFFSARQRGFNMANALKEASQFPYRSIELKTAYSNHKQVVERWLESL